MVEFGEWLCTHVLRPVQHRHFVLSIPKILRRFFRAAAVKQKKRLSVASNTFILCILYFAFSKTARNPDFLANLRSLIGPFGYLAAAHLLLLAAAYGGQAVWRGEDYAMVVGDIDCCGEGEHHHD